MKNKPTKIIASFVLLLFIIIAAFLIKVNFDLQKIRQENLQLKKQFKETTLNQLRNIVDLTERMDNLEQNYQNQTGKLSETSENVSELQNRIEEQNNKLNDYQNCKKFWSSDDPSYCDRIYSF